MTIRKNNKPYTENITGINKTTIRTKDGENIVGYDITEVRRNILIKEETIEVEEGTKDLRTEDTWEISIILKNLETNQQLNTDKEVKGEVLIQSEKLKPIQEILLADANKEGEETLLFHNGTIKIDGQIMDAEDYSYRYSGASDDVHNYICFGGPCSNKPEEEEKYSNLYRIIGLFPTDASHTTYQMKIIKADYATEKETGGTGVGGYFGNNNVYEGNENYLGNKELYYTKIGSYFWGTTYNNWKTSYLNAENLNEYFLNVYIKNKDSSKWTNMLDKHNWVIAGNTYNLIGVIPKEVYNMEMNNSDIEKSKVGLMYVSDYMYGANKIHWNKKGSTSLSDNYGLAKDDNWIYMGLMEWTITPAISTSVNVFWIRYEGGVGSSPAYAKAVAIRPTMYLNSNVKIIDGDGTSINPYKIEV